MSNLSERSHQNDTPGTVNGGGGAASSSDHRVHSAKAHRQWQAALNLLWAASHVGHNTTDSPLTALQVGATSNGGPRDSGFHTETLGPSQSGGMSTTFSSGEGGAGASQQQRGKGGASTGQKQGPTNLAEFLRTVPHFYLLSPPQLQHLVDFALRRDFVPGEVVLEDGVEVTHVRVVLAGIIDVVDRHHGTVGHMEACSVFSLDSIIIGEKSPFRFVCSRPCSLLLLPASEVLRVLGKNPSLRQSIGRKMSGQMSCFRVLKEFSRLLFSHDAMKYEYIPLQALLESYSTMPDSVVHPLKSYKDIDTTAWYYAIQRLPENITRVFSLDLVRSLPPFLATRMRSLTRKAERARQLQSTGDQDEKNSSPQLNLNASSNGTNNPFNMNLGGQSMNDALAGNSVTGMMNATISSSPLFYEYRSRDIRYVHTSQRRRCVWQLGIDGKNIVLMRDDFTDILDFVLSLCIHITESAKLRQKLQSLVHPSAIDVIEESLFKHSALYHQQASARRSTNASGHHTRTASNDATTVPPGISVVLPGSPSGMMTRSVSGVPTTIANATGYNGIRDVTGRHSLPNSPITPPTPAIGGLYNNSAVVNSGSHTGLPQLTTEQLLDILQNQLKLPEHEAQGIINIWGSNTLLHVHDVLMHREEYLLRADSSVARRFQSDPFHDWALGVRGAIIRRLNLDTHSALPDDLSIDLVFGLTRSILNCLSPCARIYREELLEYGNREHPEVMSQPWINEEDKLYALIPDFLNEHPDMREQFNSHLDECGIEVLEDTALTGLQADIICSDFLDPSIDPWLEKVITSNQHQQQNVQNTNNKSNLGGKGIRRANNNTAAYVSVDNVNDYHRGGGNNIQENSSSGAHFFINIDYTFGAQAEGILKTLVTLFGKRIRSVNVLGKIAGFKGTKAGDIIIADNVVASKMSLTSEDHMDEIRTINNLGIRMERVQEFLGNKRKVRRGSVLTVASAMVCDHSIISYYKNIWNCVGFEIEGSYFARMVKECKSNGLLQQDLPTRHLYLVRELPEENNGSTTFARPRFAGEVLAAQYAISRTVLDLVLRRDVGGEGSPVIQLNNNNNNTNTNNQHQSTGLMSRSMTAPIVN
jgi:hypothetical protein